MQRQSRRQYTAEYKAQGVLLAESLGAAGAARKLGISVKTLAIWIRLSEDGRPISSGKRRAVSDLEAENSRLRAENATLRMERDVLKKKRRRSSPRSRGEERLNRIAAYGVSDRTAVPGIGRFTLGLFRLATTAGSRQS